MEIYELIEKLGKQGYSKKELSIVYFDAKINKKMKDSEITEEYLISNITNVKQEYELTKEEFESHVNKKMDFILQGMGIVYALSNIIIETDQVQRELDNLNKLEIKIKDCRKYGRVSLIFLN